jgi:hypothetical protein
MVLKLILALSTSLCSRKNHRELPSRKRSGGTEGDGLFNNIAFIGQNLCLQNDSSEAPKESRRENAFGTITKRVKY